MSGSPGIADLDAVSLHNDGDQFLTLRILQHPLQGFGIPGHIMIFEFGLLPPEVLTGLSRMGSSVLAENQYFLLHIGSRIWIT